MATIELTPSKVDMVYESKRTFLRRISNSVKDINLQNIPRNGDVPYANTVFKCARVLANMGVSSFWIRRNSRKCVVATLSVVNPTIVPSRLNLEELPPLPDHRDSPQQRDEGSNDDYLSCSSSPPRDVIPETDSDIDDVNNRKRRHMDTNTHDVISETDSDGNIDDVNDPKRRRTGTSSSIIQAQIRDEEARIRDEERSQRILQLSGDTILANAVVNRNLTSEQWTQVYEKIWIPPEDETVKLWATEQDPVQKYILSEMLEDWKGSDKTVWLARLEYLKCPVITSNTT